MTNENRGLGLYIHWPFCLSKCPYCDFNSHVAARIDQRRWQAAFLAELERVAAETRDRVLVSVFFGGGTPSLMDPDVVAAVLEKVRSCWPMANDPEITLEANPTSVEAGRFAAYRAGGVNRVSIGVQALDDNALRLFGRTHSTRDAIRAIETAQRTFPRASFDLIYARQGQDMDAWSRELTRALALKPTHLSLYQLTIEEGTVFHERNRRGLLKGLPDEDLSADLYLLTQELCTAAGLPAYEVSNHAAAGEESRHNLIYWRGEDYVGIGPGAHGRLTLHGQRTATEAPMSPEVWLSAVEQHGAGELPRHALTPEEAGHEYCLMGLRLVDGLSLSRYRTLTGRALSLNAIHPLVEAGMLDRRDDNLRATAQGMLVLNAILRDLLLTSGP